VAPANLLHAGNQLLLLLLLLQSEAIL